MLTLYIGNKTYSSWSLRGWLAAKLSGEPFQEVSVGLTGGYHAANRTFSPSARVPALHDGDIVVWDSLSIAEYLAERHPPMWPRDAAARAWARSAAAEMHSGFADLRNDMTMCVRERIDVRPWSHGLANDIARILELWTEGRSRFGAGGPFLCGPFTLVDAFFAPVAYRFRTYGVPLPEVPAAYHAAMLAHPLLQEWERGALAETAIVDADEPRIVYRDKLAARDGTAAAV